MAGKLSREEVENKLGNWKVDSDKIEKEFSFEDFKGSMGFVNKVANEAESMNHHPEIDINFNKVEIELSTHSEGGVTDKDIELAGKIEEIYDSN